MRFKPIYTVNLTDSLTDLGILSTYYSSDAKAYTKEEFLLALWNKIRSVIENSPR
jgi:hypothetical protein